MQVEKEIEVCTWERDFLKGCCNEEVVRFGKKQRLSSRNA